MGFIKEIKIKNFKKFKNLEVHNIGQFNLISGDNNVGKSTLLEAVVIIQDDTETSLEYLHRSLCIKNLHIHPRNINSKSPIIPLESYFDFIKNDLEKPIEFEWKTDQEVNSIGFQDFLINQLNESDFKLQRVDNYNVSNTRNWIKIYRNGNFDELQWMYLDDFKRNLQYGYWELITYNAGFDYDVNTFYAENFGIEDGDNNKDLAFTNNQLEIRFKALDYKEKKKFLDTLALFVPDIEDTTVRNHYKREILSIKTKSINDYYPVTFWGEGFNKFIRYLLEIIKCQGKKILIDEIDTGIHWTKLKRFWDYIILSCKESEVQLFATTHSLECIDAFLMAAKEINLNDDIRLIELKEAKVNNASKIYSNTYLANQIQSAINSDFNIRGGKIYGEY